MILYGICFLKVQFARKRKQFKLELRNEGVSETITCAMYVYMLKLIVEATFQITHTPKHSQVPPASDPMTFTQPIRLEY